MHSPSGKECRWHDDTRLGSVKLILERRGPVATTMRMELPPVDWGKGTNPSPFIHDSPRGPHLSVAADVSVSSRPSMLTLPFQLSVIRAVQMPKRRR